MHKKLMPLLLAATLLLAGCGTRDIYGSGVSNGTGDPSAEVTSDNSEQNPGDVNSSETQGDESSTPPVSETRESVTTPAPVTTPPAQTTPPPTTTPPVQTVKPKETTPPPVNPDEVVGFQFKFNGKWEDDYFHDKCTYEIVLANYTDAPISNWSVKIPVPTDSQITASWSAAFSKTTSGTLTITPGKNGTIPAHGTINVGFHIVMNANEELTTPGTLEANGVKVKSKYSIKMP